jgi:hypothetical protein
MKIKSAALFLIIASAVAVLIQVYWKVSMFFNDNFTYYKEHPIDFALSFLWILLPLALLFLGITLYKSDVLKNELKPETSTPAAQTGDIPSPGDWFLTFFITAIPIVGIIMLIVWALDDSNMIRKNWAIGSLLWAVLVLVLFIILFISLASTAGRLF